MPHESLSSCARQTRLLARAVGDKLPVELADEVEEIQVRRLQLQDGGGTY